MKYCQKGTSDILGVSVYREKLKNVKMELISAGSLRDVNDDKMKAYK
jgi:hypothetical protein